MACNVQLSREKMSADVASISMKHSYCETFHAEWKLTNLLSHKGTKLMSSPFCPVPDLNVKFYFDISFLEYTVGQSTYALLKFILVKGDESIVPDSMKLEIEMDVEYSDGTLFKEYRRLPIAVVKEMDYYYFEEIRTIFEHNGKYYDTLGKTLRDNLPIFLKCRFKFFDHIQESPENDSPRPVSFSLKTSENISHDIKSLRKYDKSSDIVIHCGSRLFFGHKAVLANHSPVLKQMIDLKSEEENFLDLSQDIGDAFDEFLDYLYEGKFEYTSWPKLRDLYVLSAKYEVLDLKEKCAAAILSLLSVDRVSEILKIACDHEDLSLKEPATKFAAEHLRDIISCKEWKELIISHPLIGNEVTVNAFKL